VLQCVNSELTKTGEAAIIVVVTALTGVNRQYANPDAAPGSTGSVASDDSQDFVSDVAVDLRPLLGAELASDAAIAVDILWLVELEHHGALDKPPGMGVVAALNDQAEAAVALAV
jgi:hypothetical protein